MRNLLVIGLILISALAIMPEARGATLFAGDILHIGFSTLSPVCPSGPCDVLELFPNMSGSFLATNVTAKLLVGNTLLGTYSSAFCCVPTFRSPSSLFQAGSATVDFTAINAGTVNGIIDMSIGTGFLTWPSTPTPSMLIGHGDGPGFVTGGTGVQINSVTILVPEPSSIALLLGGLVFVGLTRRYKLHACMALHT